MADKRKSPPGSRRTIPIVLLLVILAGAAWLLFRTPEDTSLVGRAIPEGDTRSAPPAASSRPETDGAGVASVPPQNTAPVIPGGRPERKSSTSRCGPIAQAIKEYLNELDGRAYLADFQLEAGAGEYFRQLLAKLFANPPVVVRETDDLFTILGNMTHFFKVLGGRDIQLIREVLGHEQENLEQVMALFYEWSLIGDKCPDRQLELPLPLEGLYDYSAFFLNTLGGQSYLFRRSPRFRVLMKYYAVLILDRANDAGLNRHGIDIRFPVETLIGEVRAVGNLEYRHTYLEVLHSLQDKYRLRYGGKRSQVSPIWTSCRAPRTPCRVRKPGRSSGNAVPVTAYQR